MNHNLREQLVKIHRMLDPDAGNQRFLGDVAWLVETRIKRLSIALSQANKQIDLLSAENEGLKDELRKIKESPCNDNVDGSGDGCEVKERGREAQCGEY